MKFKLQNTRTFFCFLFLILITYASNAQDTDNQDGTLGAGSLRPPKVTKSNSTSGIYLNSTDNTHEDTTFYSYFPACVQNSDLIRAHVFIDYYPLEEEDNSNNRINACCGIQNPSGGGVPLPDASNFEKIDVILKVYEGNTLIYTETKSAIENGGLLTELDFDNFGGYETTKNFVFEVHSRFVNETEDNITSVEYPVQFGLGCDVPTLIEELVAYPNPTYSNPKIKLNISQESDVTIWRFSSGGQSTLIVDNTRYNAGEHDINFPLPSIGTYYYRIIVFDGSRVQEGGGTVIKRERTIIDLGW